MRHSAGCKFVQELFVLRAEMRVPDLLLLVRRVPRGLRRDLQAPRGQLLRRLQQFLFPGRDVLHGGEDPTNLRGKGGDPVQSSHELRSLHEQGVGIAPTGSFLSG